MLGEALFVGFATEVVHHAFVVGVPPGVVVGRKERAFVDKVLNDPGCRFRIAAALFTSELARGVKQSAEFFRDSGIITHDGFFECEHIARVAVIIEFVRFKVANERTQSKLVGLKVARRHKGLEHGVNESVLEHIDKRRLIRLMHNIGAIAEFFPRFGSIGFVLVHRVRTHLILLQSTPSRRSSARGNCA